MPALPDRSGRAAPRPDRRRRHRWRLRGHQRRPRAGPARRRGHPARDPHAGLGRLDPQRRDRPRRLQVERPRAHREVRRGHRQGALPGDARLVPAGQAAHRRRGHRVRVPRGRPPRAGVRPVARPGARPRPGQPGRRRRDVLRRAARADPRGDRHRRVLRRARRRGQRPAPSRASTSPGWPPRPTRRRRPARGRPRPLDPPPGRWRLRRRDVAGRDPGQRRVRGHQRLHGRRRPVAASADDGHRLVHHRLRAAARGPRPRAVAQGPLVLRHQELPVLLARLAGPPDGLRRAGLVPADVDRQDRADPVEGPPRGPPAAGRAPHRVRVGRQRRVHLRPDAARRPDEGRRGLRPGLLRHRRRAHDLPRDEGRGVAGRWPGAGPDQARRSRSSRRRTRVVPGSCRWSASGTACRTALRRARAARDSRVSPSRLEGAW